MPRRCKWLAVIIDAHRQQEGYNCQPMLCKSALKRHQREDAGFYLRWQGIAKLGATPALPQRHEIQPGIKVSLPSNPKINTA